MDAFSYLSVLLSIILGLAITQVLQGIRGLLLARSHVRFFLPTLVWAGLILLTATQFWWASFGLAGHAEWTFGAFALVLVQTTLLYMMAALVLPDFDAHETRDLREHYFREQRPFFIVTAAMVASSIVKETLIEGRLPAWRDLAFQFLYIALTLVLAVSRRERLHHALALAMVGLVVAYIALLFTRLG